MLNGSAIAANGNFTPLENGYEYILRRDGLIHVSAWAELRYRSSSGKTSTVWPYVMQTESITITNKVAAFIGRKAIPDDREPKREVLVNRVIAIEAPGPALDISDQILKLWCMEKGSDLPVALKTFNVVSLRRVASGIEVDFIVAIERKPTGITFRLKWKELLDAMKEVTAKGKRKKEKWSGIEYLQLEIGEN
jgi:hypothetical protein